MLRIYTIRRLSLIAVAAWLFLFQATLAGGAVAANRPQASPKRATKADASTFLDKGIQLLKEEKYGPAIAKFSAAIRRDPDMLDAYKLRGFAYHRKRIFRRAIRDYSEYLEKQPSDARVHALRGDARNFRLDHKEALHDFNKALALGLRTKRVYMGRGLANTALERYKEAIVDYQLARRLDPKDNEALINLGRACMLAGKPLAAMGYLQRALEREDDPQWKSQINAWMDELLENPEVARRSGFRRSRSSREVFSKTPW